MSGRPTRRGLLFGGAATAALAAVAGLSGCADGEKPNLVVTTNILGDVVQQMVGDAAGVHVLMKPNADPHSFGVSAKEAGMMESADLIIANGLGLEEGLGANLDNARSQGVTVLEVGDHIETLAYQQGATEGTPDPHFWTDPQRMIAATQAILDALEGALDGNDISSIRNTAQAYREQLEDLDSEVASMVAEIPEDKRKLVTNHHVFGYFADRFGFEVIGAVVPSGTTLAAPSASDLDDLAGAIEDAGVPAIFADSSQPQKLADVLADEAGIDVEVQTLYTESLTEPDGEAPTYIAMQEFNAQRISSALTG